MAETYEYVGPVPGTSVIAHVNKVGGGTVGRKYVGTWGYRLTIDGEPVFEGADLIIPLLVTHECAAKVAFEFFAFHAPTAGE